MNGGQMIRKPWEAPRIVWDPQFSVGVELLDKHHQILLVQINRLADWIEKPGAWLTYRDILNQLILYAEIHFKTEEAMLERSRYPDLIPHRQGHMNYVAQVTEIAQEAASGIDEKIRLQTFLVDWWSKHILVSDRAYKGTLS